MCCGGCGAIACIFTGTAMMTAPCISTLTVMPARPYRIPARLTRMRMAFRWRSLLVGLMHGMAGSAALLVLAASQASSAAAGLAYIAVFGIGSMVGMGALSAVIAVPLAVSARWLTWANSGLQGAVGVLTIAIGVTTVVAAI